MDKKVANQIVSDTFNASFEKEAFVYFIKNLLNHIEEVPFVYRGNFIPDAYDKSINTLERIGKYDDGENKIDILIVNLKKETSIERARTMQRNFIAWYLNGSRGGELKDAALVAFVSPNQEDWRFSLVKMDYKFEETKDGRRKVKEVFTPARRWSFLVGKNENSHTAQSRLSPIVCDDEHNPTLKELEDAFNIEKVTKEFFEKYRELFLWAKESFDKILKKESGVRKDFEAKGVNTVDFTKKLLGQIVFLYFLQKKGWFGVERDSNWGTGPKNFLRELFDSKHSKYNNFFNDILEPLFYEALAREREDNFYSRFNCKIPFLNGGLFDPINNYDWVHTDINLPNELFSNKYKTKEGDIGNGILDIFDRYNFTVKEDEPLEKEVAVDPEMLGKVFENLLEVKDRKSKGTYYTPREIVHYMCEQSLLNYLSAELEGKVEKEEIEKLIKYGESVIENETHTEAKGKETKKYNYKLPESIRENAKLIDEKLADIKVCDPAVGSGAFPVGMMAEIIKVRSVLSAYIKDKKNRTTYDFKRYCIQNSLYGVDIDLGAVEIAKLRLWLSLVVDEEDIKTIKPLPNLDYKIVCGDSLSKVEKNLFNQQLFAKLEELKPFFFNETDSNKKREYKKQIDEIIKKITNGHKDFDFEIYFSEVFHNKRGFDVVIANPPYISYGLRGGQKMSPEEKERLKHYFPESAEYKISLYAIFMDKAIQLSKPKGGIQTFIVPDSFLLGRYFSKIRKFILQLDNIISILLLPYSVFQATVGFSVVYLFQRKEKIDENHKIVARYAKNNESVRMYRFAEFSYEQTRFNKLKHNRFRLFFDKQTMNLVSKMEDGSIELGGVIKFSSGLIGKDGQDSIISKEKKNKKWLPGIVSGSEIRRYIIKPAGNFLLYDELKIKSGYEGVEYFNDKILLRQTGDSLVCAFDNSKTLALNNIHVGNLINHHLSLKYVSAVLNSFIMNYYYKSISLEANRAMAQIDIETLEGLPIKEIFLERQEPFIKIVDKILDITKSDDYLVNSKKQAEVKECESQIDEMVYKLYDLTPEEIKIVENNK